MTDEAAGPEIAGEGERAEIRRLTVALEDIVAIALSAGDARQRAGQMHRRAVAALSGTDRRPKAPDAG
ncbi:MAG TPA: hypothetical protein VHG51_16035 [Longimicrobiaceae bacterium]|nr:hypothetical protein [Longimicrobiaceae bacterium]